MTDREAARKRLVDALNEEHNPSYWGADTRDAEQLIDDFVHELAEKIRYADCPANATDGADYAADLIDPEVQP